MPDDQNFFHRTRNADGTFDRYRFDPASSGVVCERITPRATMFGAANVRVTQFWQEKGHFLCADVPMKAKNAFMKRMSELGIDLIEEAKRHRLAS
jgi:hypothetical protein